MRQEKINEIMELLKSDPRNRPAFILYWPKGFQRDSDEYECHLRFSGSRPDEIVTVQEGKQYQKLYPDVYCIKVAYKNKGYDKERPKE